jgi:hypothetical protein
MENLSSGALGRAKAGGAQPLLLLPLVPQATSRGGCSRHGGRGVQQSPQAAALAGSQAIVMRKMFVSWKMDRVMAPPRPCSQAGRCRQQWQ